MKWLNAWAQNQAPHGDVPAWQGVGSRWKTLVWVRRDIEATCTGFALLTATIPLIGNKVGGRPLRNRKPRNLGLILTMALLVVVSQPVTRAEVDHIAAVIRAEATRPNESPEGRPLPLVSHWTTGKHPAAEGWAPQHQIRLIEQGHFLLPWFEHPDDEKGMIEGDDNAFREYYEWAIKRASDLKLPLVFVASEWERALSEEPYLSLSAEQNPNVVTPSGKVLPMISPFGPTEPWREVGRKLTANPRMKALQSWYPDPPKIIFLSNNEHQKLHWTQAEHSLRYLKNYGSGKDDDFKRNVVAEGWITHYRAFQEGMREGLDAPAWQANAIFVGYDAFGPPHLGRWGGWLKHSLYTPGRIDPHPLMWDGGSPSFYTHSRSLSTDFMVFSPQIEFMNLVFQQKEAYRLNPDFWLELSVWDGYEPNALTNDKRKQYAFLGQTYTPQRYAGMVQFGMWLLRPRVVREFRAWLHPWDDGAPYFMAIVDAVDRIHRNPILKEWWQIGELVPNPSHQHPYEENIPDEYTKEDRWFLLDADVNPANYTWKLTPIPVYALALVKGKPPEREWLVYAHSPLGDRKNVQLTVPGYGTIKVDVGPGGSFSRVHENGRIVSPVR